MNEERRKFLINEIEEIKKDIERIANPNTIECYNHPTIKVIIDDIRMFLKTKTLENAENLFESREELYSIYTERDKEGKRLLNENDPIIQEIKNISFCCGLVKKILNNCFELNNYFELNRVNYKNRTLIF
jgi:hypothetical protein